MVCHRVFAKPGSNIPEHRFLRYSNACKAEERIKGSSMRSIYLYDFAFAVAKRT